MVTSGYSIPHTEGPSTLMFAQLLTTLPGYELSPPTYVNTVFDGCAQVCSTLSLLSLPCRCGRLICHVCLPYVAWCMRTIGLPPCTVVCVCVCACVCVFVRVLPCVYRCVTSPLLYLTTYLFTLVCVAWLPHVYCHVCSVMPVPCVFEMHVYCAYGMMTDVPGGQ